MVVFWVYLYERGEEVNMLICDNCVNKICVWNIYF